MYERSSQCLIISRYMYIYYSIIPGFNYIAMLSIESGVILMLSKCSIIKIHGIHFGFPND